MVTEAPAERTEHGLQLRAFAGLHLPHGPLAAKLKIGHEQPPSERPKPEPEPPPKKAAGKKKPAK